MISPNFYTKNNLVLKFLEGKISHYPVKDKSITTEWYVHTIRANENIYSLAVKIFGDNMGHLWTYIADNNPPRLPDDWNAGDVIRLPKIILKDTDTIKTSYNNEKTTTTPI